MSARAGTLDRRDQDLHRLAPRRSPRSRRRCGDDADSARARLDAGGAGVDARARGGQASVAEAHARADRALVVARGYEYATAREWAIKLKELAHVFADPYSAADFQHGPVALVEPGVPVIVVVRDGPAAAGLIALLGRLRDDFDADVTVLSDVPEALAVASRAVALPQPWPPSGWRRSRRSSPASSMRST